MKRGRRAGAAYIAWRMKWGLTTLTFKQSRRTFCFSWREIRLLTLSHFLSFSSPYSLEWVKAVWLPSLTPPHPTPPHFSWGKKFHQIIQRLAYLPQETSRKPSVRVFIILIVVLLIVFLFFLKKIKNPFGVLCDEWDGTQETHTLHVQVRPHVRPEQEFLVPKEYIWKSSVKGHQTSPSAARMRCPRSQASLWLRSLNGKEIAWKNNSVPLPSIEKRAFKGMRTFLGTRTRIGFFRIPEEQRFKHVRVHQDA